MKHLNSLLNLKHIAVNDIQVYEHEYIIRRNKYYPNKCYIHRVDSIKLLNVYTTYIAGINCDPSTTPGQVFHNVQFIDLFVRHATEDEINKYVK